MDNSNSVAKACYKKETLTFTEVESATMDINPASICSMIFVGSDQIYGNSGNEIPGIENKDLSDRFLTALILSLIICLANIGLALFGFLLFRTPGDF